MNANQVHELQPMPAGVTVLEVSGSDSHMGSDGKQYIDCRYSFKMDRDAAAKFEALRSGRCFIIDDIVLAVPGESQ